MLLAHFSIGPHHGQCPEESATIITVEHVEEALFLVRAIDAEGETLHFSQWANASLAFGKAMTLARQCADDVQESLGE